MPSLGALKRRRPSQVARTAALSHVLEELAESFREVRGALNRLSDTILHFEAAVAPDILTL